VTTDTLGNVYVTGAASGALPGQVWAGADDVFLVRFDALGSRTLTRQWGSAQSDTGAALALDGLGNVYIAGYAEGAFGGQLHLGGNDAFLMKLSASTGDPAWTRFWGTTASDAASGVVVDAGGGVFVCGETRGALDGNLAVGGADLFLTRFSATGDRQWTRQRGTANDDGANALVAAPAGFLTLVGGTEGALDGRPNVGSVDVAALRFDLDGVHQWTRTWGSTAPDYGHAIAADATGHAWIAGGTEGALNGRPNTGDSDAFLLFVP
jgi:hypothetical protein